MNADDFAALLADIGRGRIRTEYRDELVRIVEAYERVYNARVATIAAGREARRERIRAASQEAAVYIVQACPDISLKEAIGMARKRAWELLRASNPNARCPSKKTIKEELLPYFQISGTSRATYSGVTGYSSTISAGCASTISST